MGRCESETPSFPPPRFRCALPLFAPQHGQSGRRLRIAALLKTAGLAASNGEANRKLAERAVRVDGEVFEDAQRVFLPGFEGVIQVGKRNFVRVRLDLH